MELFDAEEMFLKSVANSGNAIEIESKIILKEVLKISENEERKL